MQLRAAKEPLRLVELPVPAPARGQVLIRVSVCAVCRTDLHIVNGELSEPKLPLVIGHMIVGRVERAVTASASPGLGTSTKPAASAAEGSKTFASTGASPAIRSTAAMPSSALPTNAFVLRYPRAMTTCMPHRCSAPA